MTIKRNGVAIAAVLAAVAMTSIAVPAFAQTKATAGWDTCYAAAIERGSGPNRGGGTKEHSQHKAFMDQCMAGKIPLTAEGATCRRRRRWAALSRRLRRRAACEPSPCSDQIPDRARHATLNALKARSSKI